MIRESVRLREITTLITKGTTPSTIGSSFEEGCVNFIKSESVTLDGRIDESIFAHISESTHAKLRRSQLANGDILFSIAGMKLGKSAIVRTRHLPANTNQALAVIRPNLERVSSEYLHYWFLNPSHYDLVNKITAQAAQPNINLAQIGNLVVLLPSHAAQHRIAAILSAYDDLIENCERRIRVLDEMARALYREWFVLFRYPGNDKSLPLVASLLGNIPRDWTVKAMGDIATVTMGLSPKGNTYNERGEGTPLVNGPVEFGERFTRPIKWTTAPTKLCKEGDLVVCVRGATTGKYVKSDGEYCLGRGVCAFSSIYQGFVDQLFISELPVLLAKTGGSTFPSWTGPQLKSHLVRCPPSSLLAKFEALVRPMITSVAKYSSEIDNLRKTRDLLLPRLLSGQLSVEPSP